MDIKDFLKYFWRMKWIIALSCILLTLFSGIFTYMTKSVTYYADNVVVAGPQPDAQEDGHFRDKMLYVMADFIKYKRTAEVLSERTGLDIDKDSLYAMVSQSVNDQYQRLELTVSGSDPEVVKTVAEQLPYAIITTAEEVFGITNLKVQYDEAVVKSSSVSYERNIIAGAVAGIGVGFLIVFILLIFDDRFKDRQGVKRIYNIDDLGEKEKGISPAKFLLKTQKRSARIITHLLRKTGSEHSLYELARFIGGLGKKVLVIDLLKQDGKPGISDLLAEEGGNQESLANLLAKTEDNVYVLTAGTKTLPFTALYNGTFRHLVANAAFDLILINASPDLGLEQIAFIAQASDGTVLALEEKGLTVSQTTELMNHLKELDVPLLGYYMV